jgi:hypothetical protein
MTLHGQIARLSEAVFVGTEGVEVSRPVAGNARVIGDEAADPDLTQLLVEGAGTNEGPTPAAQRAVADHALGGGHGDPFAEALATEVVAILAGDEVVTGLEAGSKDSDEYE